MELQQELYEALLEFTRPELAKLVSIYLVKGKEGIDESMFTNPLHYKLSRSMRGEKAIGLAKNYVLFYPKSWFVEPVPSGHGFYYLIGVNSDLRLFCNLLESLQWGYHLAGRSLKSAFEEFSWFHRGRLSGEANRKMKSYRLLSQYPIGLVDFPIESVLGFKKDLETVSDKSLPSEEEEYGIMSGCRLQGDICIYSRPFTSLEEMIKDYKGMVVHESWRAATRFLRIVIAKRILDILENMGITAELSEEETVNFYGVPKSTYKRKERVSKLMKSLLERVVEELPLQDLGIKKNLELREYAYFPSVKDVHLMMENNLPALTIGTTVDDEDALGNYLLVKIKINPSYFYCIPFLEKALEDIDISFDEQTVNVGRHKIVYEGLPRKFSFRLRVASGEEVYQSVNINTLYIKAGSVLRVTHPEHPTVKVKVKRYCSATLTPVRISPLTHAKFNAFVLKSL